MGIQQSKIELHVTNFDGGVKKMIRLIINLFWPAKKHCDVTHLIWKAKKKTKQKKTKQI